MAVIGARRFACNVCERPTGRHRLRDSVTARRRASRSSQTAARATVTARLHAPVIARLTAAAYADAAAGATMGA